jgi:translation elongation factor EF-Tu-like GTPase
MKKIMTAFYTKLLHSGMGRSMKGYEKIKNLPEKKDEGKINRANVWERNIIKFCTKY